MGSSENRGSSVIHKMSPEVSVHVSPIPTMQCLGVNSNLSAVPEIIVAQTQSQNQQASVAIRSTGSTALEIARAATNVDGSSVAGASAKSKRISQLTSVAWSYFEKFITEDGKNKAKCNNCPKIYAADSSSNETKNLLAHIKKCPGNPENHVIEPRQQCLSLKSVEKGKEGMLTSWHFDQQASRSALAEMLVTDELPLSFVEGQGFRKFISVLYPNFKIPSRKSSTRDVFGIYESEKEKLHSFFQSSSPRVSLTTDTWTSIQNINYLCLTAHYIDNDWVLQKKIINFCPIVSHKGNDLFKSVEACLQSWGISKIMTVTVDNATPNDVAIGYLSRRMNLLCSNVLDGRFMHMRCIAHIINLIVSDGIGMLGISVKRVRYVVRFIKISPLRLSRFKLCVTQAGLDSKKLLCLDVPTRWNSTYLMLQAACRLEKAFERYDEVDPTLRMEMETKPCKDGIEPLGMLTYQDWEELNTLVSFLKHFYDMTVKVSGSKYVTSNVILDEISDLFHLINRGLLPSENVEMKSMCVKMKSKYKKYFADKKKLNMFIFIAPVLDPRKKLDYVNYIIGNIYPPELASHVQQSVKECLNELFAQYVNLYDSTSESTMSQADSGTSVSELTSEGVSYSFADYKRQKCIQEGIVKSELERYLKEDEERMSIDVLNWWSMNRRRYPVISKMARDILAIPISTVASESAFSTGGRVLTDFRSSLSPIMVQALICTQDWLKIPCGIKTNEELEELQNLEEEVWSSANEKGVPPQLQMP